MRRLFPVIVYFVTGQPISIPVGFRGNGIPYFNGSVPSLFGDSATISFNLKSGSTSFIWIETPLHDRCFYSDMNLTVNASNTNVSVTLPDVSVLMPADPQGLSVDMVRASDIRISRSSSIVRAFRSIDILRNRALITLDDSALDGFYENCTPETAMIIPFLPQSSESDADLSININLGDGLTHEMAAYMHNSLSSMTIMEIHANHIQGLLDIVGSDLTSDNRIARCTRVRDRLPAIIISVKDSTTPSRFVGYIVLYPEDYTRLDTDGSCTLLVGVSTQRPNIAYINPLMIPDMNVRFTPDYMIMCDSLDG